MPLNVGRSRAERKEAASNEPDGKGGRSHDEEMDDSVVNVIRNGFFPAGVRIRSAEFLPRTGCLRSFLIPERVDDGPDLLIETVHPEH